MAVGWIVFALSGPPRWASRESRSYSGEMAEMSFSCVWRSWKLPLVVRFFDEGDMLSTGSASIEWLAGKPVLGWISPR